MIYRRRWRRNARSAIISFFVIWLGVRVRTVFAHKYTAHQDRRFQGNGRSMSTWGGEQRSAHVRWINGRPSCGGVGVYNNKLCTKQAYIHGSDILCHIFSSIPLYHLWIRIQHGAPSSGISKQCTDCRCMPRRWRNDVNVVTINTAYAYVWY